MMKNTQRGFTLFLTAVVTGTLLLVAYSIVNLSVKQSNITNSMRNSHYAFYAADAGMECALYWDVKHPDGTSAFNPSRAPGGTNISCGTFLNQTVGTGPVSNFEVTFAGLPYCAKVTVTKTSPNITTIDSYGYNTCNTSDPARVERAVKATYP